MTYRFTIWWNSFAVKLRKPCAITLVSKENFTSTLIIWRNMTRLDAFVVAIFNVVWHWGHTLSACGIPSVHGLRRGGKTAICPPLEIGTKKQKFLENVKTGV